MARYRLFSGVVSLFFIFIYHTGMAQATPVKQVSKSLEIENVDSFRLEGWTRISFVHGPPSMTITGSQQELDRIQVEREGGQIFLWEEEIEEMNDVKQSLSVVVSCENLEIIQIKGAASVLLSPGFETSDLRVEIDGVSDATLHLNTSVINGSIIGVSDLELTGSSRTGELVIEAIGNLNIHGYDPGQTSVLTSGIASIR